MLPCHLILRLLFRCESWTQCEHMWRMCVSTASMLCEILLSTYRQYTDVSTRVLQSVYISFSSTTVVNTHVYFSMNSMHALKTHEYSSYFTNTTTFTYKKLDMLDLRAEIFDRRTLTYTSIASHCSTQRLGNIWVPLARWSGFHGLGPLTWCAKATKNLASNLVEHVVPKGLFAVLWLSCCTIRSYTNWTLLGSIFFRSCKYLCPMFIVAVVVAAGDQCSFTVHRSLHHMAGKWMLHGAKWLWLGPSSHLYTTQIYASVGSVIQIYVGVVG